MMRWWTVLSFFALTACADITPQPIVGPDGRQAFAMECSGYGRTLEQCYAKAGELCAVGYDVVDRASGVAVVPLANGGLLAAPKNSLIIQCR